MSKKEETVTVGPCYTTCYIHTLLDALGGPDALYRGSKIDDGWWRIEELISLNNFLILGHLHKGW